MQHNTSTPDDGTASTSRCETCNGRGRIKIIHYFTREEHYETCDACGGTGRL